MCISPCFPDTDPGRLAATNAAPRGGIVINSQTDILPSPAPAQPRAIGPGSAQPRAIGTASVVSKRRGDASVIGKLAQKGSLKLLFPRATRPQLDAVVLNTAGGLTGGDRFELAANAGSDSHVCLTTQAAERAYRAQPGETAALNTQLTLESGARLDWLPQETLLYEGSALRRSLRIEMADDARALICEPVVLGRARMGEVPRQIEFTDLIDLRRDGQLIFADRTRLSGDATAQLSGSATGDGCGAWATVILAAPDAETALGPARALLPDSGGASLIRDGVLAARLLAPDSFELRRSLIPLLECLSGAPLPRTWMI